MATIIGTRFDDRLTGTPQADRIEGRAGFDEITGRLGDDRLFGGADGAIFFWVNGDGHDRIDGGTDGSLVIAAGRQLRLHVDALGAGPEEMARNGLQVIGIRNITDIAIRGTGADDEVVLSSDADLGGSAGIRVSVDMAPGNIDGELVEHDRVDLSRFQGETSIGAYGRGDSVIRGSAGFFDAIVTGEGDDRIWTGAGGSTIDSGGGADRIHLGRGADIVDIAFDFRGAGTGHDTIFNFGLNDTISLIGFVVAPATALDTNVNGRLDAPDDAVTLRRGDLSIDLSSLFEDQRPGTTVLTLVDRTSLDLDQFI